LVLFSPFKLNAPNKIVHSVGYLLSAAASIPMAMDQDATSSLGVGYGDDHPDVKALRRMLSTAEALLQRLKSSA
jgi:hypothetical protein